MFLVEEQFCQARTTELVEKCEKRRLGKGDNGEQGETRQEEKMTRYYANRLTCANNVPSR